MTVVPRWVLVFTTSSILLVSAAFATVDVGADRFTAGSALGGVAVVVAYLAGVRPFSVPVLPGRRAVLLTAIGVLLPVVGWAGLPVEPERQTGMWMIGGALCIAVLLLWGRRIVAAWAVMLAPAAVMLLRADLGPLGLRLIEAVLLLGVATAAGWAIERTQRDLALAEAGSRAAAETAATRDAYHVERQLRLVTTTALADDMLQRIIAARGRLDPADRAECSVLHQTIRDEIRGRHLLNDAVREQVRALRSRGATVQVNDDGGLDGMGPVELDAMLDQVASALAGLQSDRVVIRTAPADSPKAITVVAMSADPVAAALGLDDGDDAVDLWLEFDRPAASAIGDRPDVGSGPRDQTILTLSRSLL